MHELEIIDNKASMFSVREIPWHKLGTIFEDRLTAQEAVKAANMDYEVKKEQIHLSRENYSTIIENYFATVRQDTGDVLGVVGNKYHVVQNTECFAFFDSIVDNDEAIFETGGVLGRGEKIWLSAKLPEHIRISGTDDLIENYLLLTNGHDGYHSVQVMFTPIRVVCNNTLNFALRNSQRKITIRHTESASDQLKMASTIMGISNQLRGELSLAFNHMAATEISEQEFMDFCMNVFLNEKELLIYNRGQIEWREILSTRKQNIIDKVRENFETNNYNEGLRTTQGTVWGAYNAVTGYIHNDRKYTDTEAQFKSEFMGAGLNLGVKAFSLAQEML